MPKLWFKKPYKRGKMRNVCRLWMEHLPTVTPHQMSQAIPPNIPHLFYDAHQLTLHGLHASGSSLAPKPKPQSSWGSLAKPIILPGSYPRKGSSGVRGRGWLIADLNISDSPTPCMSSRAGYVCLASASDTLAPTRMFASGAYESMIR